MLSTAGTLWAMCATMAVGAYLPGLAALLLPCQLRSTTLASAMSAGLLLGAGLCVILPEGFNTLHEAQEHLPKSDHLPGWVAGAALLSGFLLMAGMDAFRPSHSSHEEGCPGHMHHHHNHHNHHNHSQLNSRLSHHHDDNCDGSSPEPPTLVVEGVDKQGETQALIDTAVVAAVQAQGGNKEVEASQQLGNLGKEVADRKLDSLGDSHASAAVPDGHAAGGLLEGEVHKHSSPGHTGGFHCQHQQQLVLDSLKAQGQGPEQLPGKHGRAGAHRHSYENGHASLHGHTHMQHGPQYHSSEQIPHLQHMQASTPQAHINHHGAHHSSGVRLPHKAVSVSLPAGRMLSRQMSAPTSAYQPPNPAPPSAYHPPHPFPPSDCTLLPQCSWRPPEPDAACEREFVVGDATLQEEEEQAGIVHELIMEDSQEGLESHSNPSLCGGHGHDHTYDRTYDHTHGHTCGHTHDHTHSHTHGRRSSHHEVTLPRIHVLISEPSANDLTTSLLAPGEVVGAGTGHWGPLPTTTRLKQRRHSALGGGTPRPPGATHWPASRQRDARQALIGLVFHSCADGLAVGAAALANNLAVSLTIALSVMVHKMPVAYGLAAFLQAAGLTHRAAHNGLLWFVLACPLAALATYYLVGILPWAANPQVVAVCLLGSGGTVLHAGAVHVLPSAGAKPRALVVMACCSLIPLAIAALIPDDG